MAELTAISWCDTRRPDGTVVRGATWNTMVGCTHASEGCRFCYAESLAQRFNWGRDGFTPWVAGAAGNIAYKEHRLQEPLKWKEPRRIFVNSLSDAFHPTTPVPWLHRMFETMLAAPQHTYIILTKRPAVAESYWLVSEGDEAAPLGRLGHWPEHIWLGVTVEDRASVKRIDVLRRIPAPVRFLSCEPLLEDLGRLNLQGIGWVIAGGESGRHLVDPRWKDRLMDHAWPRSLRDQCVTASPTIPFYFKQSSAVRAGQGAALRETNGRAYRWRQWPGELHAPELAVA